MRQNEFLISFIRFSPLIIRIQNSFWIINMILAYARETFKKFGEFLNNFFLPIFLNSLTTDMWLKPLHVLYELLINTNISV